MSGKRQHFIPQFLQKGFASNSSSDESFTWVYRKNAKPFNTNIVNIGVEGYFYSEDSDNQLDDEITDAEGKFSVLVNALRNENKDAIDDKESIAEMIAHFEIRTRHLRQSASTMIIYGLEKMLDTIADSDTFISFVKRRMPSLMRNKIAQNSINHNLSPLMVETLIIGLQPHLESEISSLIKEYPLNLMAKEAKLNIPNMIKNTLKSSHIDALKGTIAPEIKVNRYKKMNFSLLRNAEQSLPLGDSIIIFQLEGDRVFKAFCEKDDIIRAVYLPLTPNLVLVGQSIDEDLDLSKLPMAIAQCSLEYFISSSESIINSNLQTHIGEYAHLLSVKQIDNMILNLINE